MPFPTEEGDGMYANPKEDGWLAQDGVCGSICLHTKTMLDDAHAEIRLLNLCASFRSLAGHVESQCFDAAGRRIES